MSAWNLEAGALHRGFRHQRETVLWCSESWYGWGAAVAGNGRRFRKLRSSMRFFIDEHVRAVLISESSYFLHGDSGRDGRHGGLGDLSHRQELHGDAGQDGLQRQAHPRVGR
jgi:hypothetical protein